jgi:hypothetical protein
VRRVRICLFVMLVVFSVCLVGCGGDDGGSEIMAPIHMEMSTDNLHPKVGLSGFVFGTFVLLNAYLIIIFSCILLIMKEQTVKKIIDTISMVAQMLNPSSAGEGKGPGILGLLSHSDTRVQIGSVGLIAGIILAYLGAWIAM